MKAPKMYLEESKDLLARSHNYRNWTEFAKSEYYRKTAIDYSAVAAHNALKSLQSDRDKELIELMKYADKMSVSSSHEGLAWEQAKSYEEKLTQFRNRK